MGNLILGWLAIFAAVGLLFIYLTASDKKDEAKLKNQKKSSREIWGEAASEVIKGTANSIGEKIEWLSLSKEKKEIANTNLVLFGYKSKYLNYAKHSTRFSKDGLINKDYSDDEELRDALNFQDISKEEWFSMCKQWINIGCIQQYEKYSFGDDVLSNDGNLRDALSYFKIPTDDFLKWGHKVLYMYDIVKTNKK